MYSPKPPGTVIAPPPRDAFLRAMRREADGYVPKNINLCPAQRARFEAEFGHADVARQWRLPTRSATLPFRPVTADFSAWHPERSDRTGVDAWGIGHEKSDDGSHFERLIHPLAAATCVADIAAFPFPSPATDADAASLREQVAAIVAQGYASTVTVAPVGGTVFWPAYKLRGMENLLCDMLASPELAEVLLDRVTEICAAQARRAAAARPDLIMMADDLGTQRSTYLSPDLFRAWLKPRLARVIAAAKTEHPDVLIHFHSDGAMQELIPDLIEIGVDILNPIQPECMDPVAIKHRYGERLSFSGCLGTQTTLPFGTPDEVRAATTHYCRHVGAGGGLWIAPTHLVEPEVPWANILAFIEAAAEFEPR
jgi:uroporphyrinogen decarboxylase